MIRALTISAILWVLTSGLTAGAVPASAWEARLEHAADGDSFTAIRLDSRKRVNVRLYGVDAPENGQAFSQASRRSLTGMLQGRTLDIRPMDEDPYGRTVAVVYVEPQAASDRGRARPNPAVEAEAGPLCVNAEQLDRGMVWFYPHFCRASFCSEWKKREQTARAARTGLWRDKNPARPWVWRKAHPRSR